MILELNRVEYCYVGPMLPGSLKLLPGTYKQQQQIVVGDQDGVLQVFSIRKEDINVHFKTLPTDKITTVRLGGMGHPVDKIFIAMENKVRAFNRKGKLFLSFDLNLTECIKSMFVSGNDLLICGNHVFNQYRDGKDLGSYLCGDSIVDVVALCPNNTNRMIAVLACSGRVLRLLEHCRVRQTIELDSVPTVLFVPRKSIGDRLLCGYADGKVTMLHINHIGLDVREIVLVESTVEMSAVTAIDMFDMSGDGPDDLLIGRRDGTVQVYRVPDDSDTDNDVRMIYSENFQESISSIQGGCVGCNGYTELVIGTYTGRVFGLTTQCAKVSLSDNAGQSGANMSAELQARMLRLANEIEELEQKVQRERDRYQQSTQSMSEGISAIPMLPINDSMVLSKDDGAYHLTIEIPSPIEFVLLQSDVDVHLMDVDKSTAVLSISPAEPMSANKLLATYRCQSDTNRVDLRLHIDEGQMGTLVVFVTPSLPPKVSQIRRYPLRPLALHMRVHAADDLDHRPFNSLVLRGAFSLAEMHTWLGQCVPELPAKIPQQDDVQATPSNVYYFRHVLLGSLLQCEYGNGTATFRTDNVTTLSILKDVLTKNATRKRIKLEISTDLNDASVMHMVRLRAGDLRQAVLVRKDKQLLDALLTMDIGLGDQMQPAIGADWQAILRRKDSIQSAYALQTHALDRTLALLAECFDNRNRLRGIAQDDGVVRFRELLHEFDCDALEAFVGECFGATSMAQKAFRAPSARQFVESVPDGYALGDDDDDDLV